MASSSNPPAPPIPIIQQCFIPLNLTYARLLQDLQNIIFLSSILDHELPPKNHLRTLLMVRYGGLPSNWPFTEHKEGLLFKSPSWLLPNEPIMDSDFWEATCSITMLPWQFITSLLHQLQRREEQLSLKIFQLIYGIRNTSVRQQVQWDYW